MTSYFYRRIGIICSLLICQTLLAQTLTISTKESKRKVLALIDLHEHGQLLVQQKDDQEMIYMTLIDNELNTKWEAEYPYEDGNGNKKPNYFTFLHNSTTIFITNQDIVNYIGKIDIETGDITYEQPIPGTSEMRKGEFYVSKESLIQANNFGDVLAIQKIRDNDNALIEIGNITPNSMDEAIKKTSIQIIKIYNDTVFAYQSLPESNHRKLIVIFYKFKTNGKFLDSSYNELSLPKYAFGFNSTSDLNCQFVFDYKNKFYLFGNLAPRLSDNFGQFPASDDSRGLWWASFDHTMHKEYFKYYPFTFLFQKEEEVAYGQTKYWGVKADADSGFFLNMNLTPKGVYTGNLTFFVNSRGDINRFTNADNVDNFMRYNPIYGRQYINNSDIIVTNDEWNFYSTHHFGKIKYFEGIHSPLMKSVAEKANKYPEDSQKDALAMTVLYKNGFAIIAEYYNKKDKEVTFEIVK
jgi:hypothetical protein